jgi:hypothetical protein
MRRLLVTIILMFLIGALTEPMALNAQQLTPRTQSAFEDSKLRGFTITLVLGEIESGRSTGTFTPQATKALTDLKDFLPYKSYRTLDTIWMLGLNGPHQFLLGPEGKKYEFYMRSTLVSPVAVTIDMLRLWDTPKGDPKEGGDILIDTSFKLNVGETIVVGTSRIDSSKGFILLVTASPR